MAHLFFAEGALEVEAGVHRPKLSVEECAVRLAKGLPRLFLPALRFDERGDVIFETHEIHPSSSSSS